MSTLERAIAIAAQAHEGQFDKGGSPYILHPLKVMMRVSTLEERMAAVLHDVVEDTPVSLDHLREQGFSQAVLAAIDALTKREGEDYPLFVERAGRDPIARVVKLADLAENSDLARLHNPTEKDFQRLEKYRNAIAYLTNLNP
ncbi:HD domain-containing protein [Pseudomonas sp. CF161]|uniref:HD domain-containing protein n=1 Tax=Pseudomonas sp. CF161 TaxID=911241 RepID=UPI00035518F6|nr:HD domain-containing protein [Pseudomonas sp. CF161]EPL10908.1 metal dependent phosphohydrolase, HD region [Pseudomonas sp. CF161]